MKPLVVLLAVLTLTSCLTINKETHVNTSIGELNMSLFNRIQQAASAARQSLQDTQPEKPVKYQVVASGRLIGSARTTAELLYIIANKTGGTLFDVYEVTNINDKLERVLKKEMKNHDSSSDNDGLGAAVSGS